MRPTVPVALALTLALAPAAMAFTGTELYDTRGRLITVLRGKQQKTEVSLAEIPQVARLAVIAIEDSRFYEHQGIDLRGMARALWTDLRAGHKVQGGSTITQQLVKNKYLNSDKTLNRKVDEALMALELERRYSKDQILEMYLNEVYWGHGAYGIEAASQTYFGHGCSTLNLPEAAVLAAMLKGPERYSPFRNPKLSVERQHVVLDRMAELGIISQADAERAKAAPWPVLETPGQRSRAGYFVSYVEDQLVARYGANAVLKQGMKVQTTIDLGIQDAAERCVEELVTRQGPRFRFDQAALVALNPMNGAILAMVGGERYDKSQYNRAILAHRQPGSTFKPFAYLTAFAQGIPDTLRMSDDPVTYMVNGKAYAPRNYQGEKEGTMSLRRALELSNNVVTTKLVHQITPEAVLATARQIGFTSPMHPTLSLGLGTYEVTPLELAAAYGVLAANGVRTEPHSYWNVRDGMGRMIENVVPAPRRVFAEAPVRLLTDALRGVILRGTGTAANIGRPVAGKTGTTQDSRDTWFAGYTPQLVVAIWAGNDNNHRMTRNAAGGVVVAPAWGRFVKGVLKNVPIKDFAKPLSIRILVASASVRPASASVPPASASSVATPAMQPGPPPTPTPEPDPPVNYVPEPDPLR